MMICLVRVECIYIPTRVVSNISSYNSFCVSKSLFTFVKNEEFERFDVLLSVKTLKSFIIYLLSVSLRSFSR